MHFNLHSYYPKAINFSLKPFFIILFFFLPLYYFNQIFLFQSHLFNHPPILRFKHLLMDFYFLINLREFITVNFKYQNFISFILHPIFINLQEILFDFI